MCKQTIIVLGMLLAGGSWGGTAIAQVKCSDIRFAPAINSRFPNAADACIGVVEHDGKQYAHFQARLVRVVGNRVEAQFKLPTGGYGKTIAFTPPADTRVRIDGQSYRYRDLSPGQELDVYLPPDRWQIAIPEEPNFATAQSVSEVPLTEPSESLAALPDTASPLPWLVRIGALLVGIGAFIGSFPQTGRGAKAKRASRR